MKPKPTATPSRPSAADIVSRRSTITSAPLEGVQGMVVDVEGKVVTVTGGDPAAIVAGIDDAGYDVA